MLEIPFTKMQGLGNDFILLDHLDPKLATPKTITPELARKLCDRRFGIGADQLLWLTAPQGRATRSQELDARMDILNSDGSVAEMCGNGIRAVGLYLENRKGLKKGQYRIQTLAGVKTVVISGDQVAVDMGLARMGASGQSPQSESIQISGQISGQIPGQTPSQIPGHTFQFYPVDVGNPHAVIFVKDVNQVPLEIWGPLLETHSRFPKQTNVEFVEIQSPHSIRVRVWERGAGATLACGTGACAAAVASLATKQASGDAQGQLKVELPGGCLKIQWEGISHPVIMTGPAREVFSGVYFLE